MSSYADKPIMPFTTPEEWERWLEQVADSDGVRLKLRKKAAVDPGLTRQEALDVALCFGWIDGQGSSFDDQFSLQSYTPRRRSSPWSIVNQEHVARLIVEGRMRESGLAEVERARADGRWDAAYRQKDAVVPAELQRAIDANPVAAEFFATISSQNRFAMIFRLGALKRESSRIATIEKYVAMLERGETLH